MVKFILYTLLISTTFAQSERSLINDGNRKFKDNKYVDSEILYRKALEKNQESFFGTFNLGDALYKQEKYAEAAEAFNKAIAKSNNREHRAKAYHNLGNSLLKAQKIPESIEAYKNSLKLNPNDMDTKYNLEFAKLLLQQQQQQQNQQQNQNKENKQDKNQKEQQKENQQNQQTPEQQEQEISKEHAERILEALRNEEKDVQKKLKKKAPARILIEKDW